MSSVRCLIVVAFALAACGEKKVVTLEGAEHSHASGEPAHAREEAQGKAHAHEEAAHGHDEGHAHKAPHGGQVVSAGKYHLEAVATKLGLVLYLLDADEAELPVTGVEGSAIIALKDGSTPVEVKLAAMGNHLMADVAIVGGWSAVVTVKVTGETLSARFEGGGEAHVHGAAAYVCPMHPEVTSDKAGACPKCGMALVVAEGGSAKPGMGLSTTVESHINASGVVEAGKLTRLNLLFHAMPEHAQIKDFEVAHERKLHVFIVSQDLSYYDHVHPDPKGDGSDGLWQLDHTFPSPGTYRIYSDFKSAALGANVTVSDFTVPGEAPAAKPVVVDGAPSKTFGEMVVTLAPSPTPIKAGAQTVLKYTLADAKGAPIVDLEPYLGAMGHLFILGEDLVTMAHSHPEGMQRGPEVTFHAVMPKAGRYKLWGQFQRAGVIVTSDFVVDVE